MAMSYSSFNSFNRCKRQYFYTYIAAHHRAKKDPLRREAFYLKQLTPAIFWPGKLVEAAIEDIIINGHPKSDNISQELYDHAALLADNQKQFSISNQFRNVPKGKNPRTYFRLFEHEYNIDDSGIQESVLEDISKCFNNYLSISIPSLHIQLHKLLNTSYSCRSQQPVPLSLFNTNITCMLDCLILYESKVIIIDWKVSKTSASDFSKQLILYALSVSRSSWGENKRLEDIYSCEVNLYNGQIKKHILDEQAIIAIEDFVFDNVKMIEGFTHGKKYKDLDIEDFPMCENLNVCQNCNFHKLCIMHGGES